MFTGCDVCCVCPRSPEQWYAPLWLAFACGMEKLAFVYENHLGLPSWKNWILYRRQFLQLWQRSTMGAPCGTSRRGVWSSSQAGRHREGEGLRLDAALRLLWGCLTPRSQRLWAQPREMPPGRCAALLPVSRA